MATDCELLTPTETAAYLRVSIGTLSVWRSTGRYPLRYVKVGRRVMYRRSDLDAFVTARTVTSTGEFDAATA